MKHGDVVNPSDLPCKCSTCGQIMIPNFSPRGTTAHCFTCATQKKPTQ